MTEAKPKVEKKEDEKCGHVNRHAHGPDGELSNIVCILKKGHEGNHRAKHKYNKPIYTHDQKGTVVKVEYEIREEFTEWGDMAGIPVEEIFATTTQQLSAYQQDIVMQVMKENQKLTSDEALAVAKSKESWKIGELLASKL